jgi:DNA-binding PadR family transcriptional regulator
MLRLKEGSVYPALYRLEREGLIKGTWESGQTERRGPRRRIYKLTRKGHAKLAAGREEWRQFVSVVGAIVGA